MNQNNSIGISLLTFILSSVLLNACLPDSSKQTAKNIFPENVLDYSGFPAFAFDKNSLTFSDQGAWFSYGFQEDSSNHIGFSGPFLMTQENGVWSSEVLSHLKLKDDKGNELLKYDNKSFTNTSFNSHLVQVFKNGEFEISQKLFYFSGHTAFIKTQITNTSSENKIFYPEWQGNTISINLNFKNVKNELLINSTTSSATGHILFHNGGIDSVNCTDSTYAVSLEKVELPPGETKSLLLSHTFIFTEYDWNLEQKDISNSILKFDSLLQNRISQKKDQYNLLENKLSSKWQDSIYKNLLAKSMLTLQNNWRIPAGELKHSGLFPSYHYEWFHGFWAWDSWKHASALAHYQPDLAKEQIRAMYYFQEEDGFIPDCVYRDTSIENHNYRNTKPPLSAWAVWEVFQQTKDKEFLMEMYPKILKQHNWWYLNRDFDGDGLCEYGSTDGSLIAAKWESGMDNAVRFDNSEIMVNSSTAFSLNQESVDLNAYLFAEKKYLWEIAGVLEFIDNQNRLEKEAHNLKIRIQEQFFDPTTGWFYDTSLDGSEFIKVMGCEGWIPLWAEVASQEQAEAVMQKMMNPNYFNTHVPFQTLSADHPKFKPDGGYWRGPNWIDQAYFGVKGLQNYGFNKEADEAIFNLIHNSEGVLENGISIRENYNPITGAGLESKNFSWSAAHYLLLLINE